METSFPGQVQVKPRETRNIAATKLGAKGRSGFTDLLANTVIPSAQGLKGLIELLELGA
jgi:hypothetical protein